MAMFKNDRGIPTDRVMALRQQGLTDNQIIQSLQHDGYDSQQVLSALELADQSAAHPAPPLQQMPELANPMVNTPKNMAPPLQQFPQGNQVPIQKPELRDSEVEELIEAIVDEKWNEFEKDINKLLEWKESVDDRMQEINNHLKILEKSFSDLHQAIVGKIGDYDKNILQVGIQLKSMEQVFSKVLPTFTDNVAELSRIAEKIKRG
jgi:hypothetical protein